MLLEHQLLCCCGDSDGAGSGYQPMMQASVAQPPAVYGINNSMQASHHALSASAAL